MKALRAMPVSSGKVGVFGMCSGGRHSFLAACRLKGFDAAVECWGGRVVMSKEELNPNNPVAPIDYTAQLSCPLLGLFGEEDKFPPLAQVQQHEAELKALGVQHLYMFGSTVRGGGKPHSDVDLFFDHPVGSIGLYELMDVKDAASRMAAGPEKKAAALSKTCFLRSGGTLWPTM